MSSAGFPFVVPSQVGSSTNSVNRELGQALENYPPSRTLVTNHGYGSLRAQSNLPPRKLAPTLMSSNMILKGKNQYSGLKTSREWGKQSRNYSYHVSFREKSFFANFEAWK